MLRVCFLEFEFAYLAGYVIVLMFSDLIFFFSLFEARDWVYFTHYSNFMMEIAC